MLARPRVFLGSLLAVSLAAGSLQPAWAQLAPPGVPPKPKPAAAAPTQPAPAASGSATLVVPTSTPDGTALPESRDQLEQMARLGQQAPSWPLVVFSPNHTANLERFDGSTGDGTWTTVCQGPCAKNLDVRHGYRVGGEGVVPSPWFRVPRSEEAFALKADTGSSTMRTTGKVLAWASPIFGAVGVTLLAVGDKREAWDGKAIAGGALLIGGVALLVTGLSLIGASSTTTSVERVPTTTAKRPNPGAQF